MKKILSVMAVIATVCLMVAVARNSSLEEKSNEDQLVTSTSELSETSLDVDETSTQEIRHGHSSASIFGMWNSSKADLDPYRSTDYYLYDNLAPENAKGRLPFELHTQKYNYVIDAYEPNEEELGVAWLKLQNDTTGETVAFKYSPASYARLRYSATSGEITLMEVEEVVYLD